MFKFVDKEIDKNFNYFFRIFFVFFLNIDLFIKNGIYYFKIVEDIYVYVLLVVYIKNINY